MEINMYTSSSKYLLLMLLKEEHTSIFNFQFKPNYFNFFFFIRECSYQFALNLTNLLSKKKKNLIEQPT